MLSSFKVKQIGFDTGGFAKGDVVSYRLLSLWGLVYRALVVEKRLSLWHWSLF